MPSVKSLGEGTSQLRDVFDNQQKRESTYFSFYPVSLIMHELPPNLQSDKGGFKQLVRLCTLVMSFIVILFFCCNTFILDVNNYVSASPAPSDGNIKDSKPSLSPYSKNGDNVT